MKTKKSILRMLVCVFLFGTTSAVFAQMPNLQWNKSLGGKTCSGPFTNDNEDTPGGVAQTPDGGFIHVSSSNSRDGDFHGNHATTSLTTDVGVVRTNSSGDTLYVKMHGGTSNDNGRSVIITKDVNFFYDAVTSSNNGDVSGVHGSSDLWAVKANLSTGAIIFQIALGGAQGETMQLGGTSVAQLSDSTYIVCGNTSSTGITGYHGGQDGYMAHLSKTGTLLNQLAIGGSSSDAFTSVVATSDGGYIIIGSTSSSNGDVTGYLGNGDMFVVKMTSSDAISWTKCFGSSGYQEEGWTIQQDYDGGYIIGGNTKGGISGYKGGLRDALSFKINSTGSIVRTNDYGGSKDDRIYSIALTPDSGFVFAAITNSNDSNVASGNYHPTSNDIWVGKVNKNGVLTGQKCYGGNDAEYPTCIIVSSDGGYVVFGQTKSSANGDVTSVGHTVTINGIVRSTQELWLFKLYTPPTPHVVGPVPTAVTPAIDRVVADPNLVEETGRKFLPAIESNLDSEVDCDFADNNSTEETEVKLLPITESNLDVPVQTLKVYYNQENLVITKPTNESEVTIYDLSGRVIENFNSLKPGFYIAISLEPDQSSQKIKFSVNY